MAGVGFMPIATRGRAGDQHYAAFLENAERFKVELVASGPVP